MTNPSPEPANSEPNTLPTNVKILGWASLLNDVASEMIFPLLPTFLAILLGDGRYKFTLGLMEGTADSVSSLLKLWSGGRSDQMGGRKQFVLFGYGIAALARPLLGIAVTPWQVLLLRLGDRIGKGVRTAPRDALIADSTSPKMRGRAFGFHRSMDHLGAALGPVLATVFLWLWPEQYRTLFLLALFPGLAVMATIAWGLREPPPVETAREKLQLTLSPFDTNFRVYLLSLLLFTLGNSSDAFLLVRASELGIPTVLLPTLWCLFHLAKSLGNYWLGKLSDRVGPRPLIFAGWFLYAAIYLGFGLSTAAWQIWPLFFGYALFYGLTEPAEKALVVNMVAPHNKGLAFGWYHFVMGLVTLPASLVFGAIYQFAGSLAAFGYGAGMALLAAVLFTVVRDRPHSVATSS